MQTDSCTVNLSARLEPVLRDFAATPTTFTRFPTSRDYLLKIHRLQSDLVLDYDLVDVGDPTGPW